MEQRSHQTVTLSRGRHRTPEHGVCAMELASMLSEDRFTDRPRRVCPVIAAFLRGYNDAVPDRLRGDLFATAAAVVGSRTPDAATREARAEACAQWAQVAWRRGRLRVWPPLFPPENAFGHVEVLGGYVGRRARRDRALHELTLRFVEELAAPAAAPDGVPERPAAVAGAAAARRAHHR